MSETNPDELAPVIMTEAELEQYCKDNNLIAVESSPFCNIRMHDDLTKELEQQRAAREEELQSHVKDGWGEGFLRAVLNAPPKDVQPAADAAANYVRACLGLPLRPKVEAKRPKSQQRGSYRKRMNAFTTAFGWTRSVLRLSVSKMQLFMPPKKLGGGKWRDPWEEWGDRVMKTTNIRLPGSWRTKRLAKKRRRALWRACGGF